MDSMNPGKAMAQASHAALAIAHDMERWDDDAWEGWKSQSEQGFGTTIVLAVESEYELHTAIAEAQTLFVAGVVIDETYPVRDGLVTHLIPVTTCGYVFTSGRDDDPVFSLRNLELHP
jgi:peptidyl-tRNA hydrolase